MTLIGLARVFLVGKRGIHIAHARHFNGRELEGAYRELGRAYAHPQTFGSAY